MIGLERKRARFRTLHEARETAAMLRNHGTMPPRSAVGQDER
jgi:hypothetical protein